MKLSIGIVGLPNVGKSTLFNTLTNQSVVAANYPFATIDPNVGVVPVPDERLRVLAEMSKSAEMIPAVVEFYDIAGLVKGAHKGEGLGNQFLQHIRECQVICIVLRVFESGDIIHVEGSVDALRDLEIIETELVLKDLETIEKFLDKVTKQAKSGDKEEKKKEGLARVIYGVLDGGRTLYAERGLSDEARVLGAGLGLLTAKRQMFLLNGREENMSVELKAAIEERGGSYVIADLFERELEGLEASGGVPELISKAYEALGLVSFFTTGEKETRAWTIRRAAKAPEAAGVIHGDFEEKFIRAEVVSCDDFVSCGGWAGAREKGKMRVEGKGYEVQDGDILVIRHG